MDPLSNRIFSHDYTKFVLQDPNVRIVEHVLPPAKPFEVKPAEKTKKDLKKKNQKEGEEKPQAPPK